jgi:hypothetical protein
VIDRWLPIRDVGLSTQDTRESMLRRFIRPTWKDTPLKSVSTEDITRSERSLPAATGGSARARPARRAPCWARPGRRGQRQAPADPLQSGAPAAQPRMHHSPESVRTAPHATGTAVRPLDVGEETLAFYHERGRHTSAGDRFYRYQPTKLVVSGLPTVPNTSAQSADRCGVSSLAALGGIFTRQVRHGTGHEGNGVHNRIHRGVIKYVATCRCRMRRQVMAKIDELATGHAEVVLLIADGPPADSCALSPRRPPKLAALIRPADITDDAPSSARRLRSPSLRSMQFP